MLVCRLGREGEGSENVYCLYTHENIDIFGWPLIFLETLLLILSMLVNGNIL